jgi:hypothetical protein
MALRAASVDYRIAARSAERVLAEQDPRERAGYESSEVELELPWSIGWRDARGLLDEQDP